VGKQVGTKPGQSSNMTWTAKLAGGARVNWDAAGAAVVSMPASLRSMSLDVAFASEVEVTAGELLALSLDVTAGVAIGGVLQLSTHETHVEIAGIQRFHLIR
jgi:hypothetical protein